MSAAQLLRRWGLVVLFGLTSLMFWLAASTRDIDDSDTAAVIYDQQLTTPVLSARRVPRSLQAPVAEDALAPALEQLAAQTPPQSCLLVEVGGRTVNPSMNVDESVIPASNMKVLTTAAALAELGPEFRFVTRVAADAAPVAGVVQGNLYLIGSGDPFLSTDDWWTQYDDQDGRYHTRLEDLADRVAAAGVTSVTGAVVGDESWFDGVRQGPWAERLITGQQSGPLSALTVNEGYVAWPAVYPGSPRQRSPTDNPPLHAATMLAQLLAERGISVGSTGAGAAPAAAVDIAEVQSPPLSEVVLHINSYSSNLGAELLTKQLGRTVTGEGSTAAGSGVVLQILQEQGVPTDGLVIVDGSGLSDANRITCRAMGTILNTAGLDSALGRSLSVGAERGSLADRFVDSPAADRVYAKTGTLNNTSALSGFVRSANDPGVTPMFAYVANFIADDVANGQGVRVEQLQQDLVVALTTYPSGPPVEELSPEAARPS
ncbi:MAG: D-alanyl-D-alanine carboxypeptidase/D-alanyl-D-alanine-endopeptidase [Acidimicrobiales bacterium]